MSCHSFIEWCGLVVGVKPHEKIQELDSGKKVYKQELYYDFILDNPGIRDPRGGGPLSRIRFNKWLVGYCTYKSDTTPEEGRDAQGRYLRMRNKHELEKNGAFDF